MIIKFNEVCKQLLNDYNLPFDLSFSFQIPFELQKKVDSEIVINSDKAIIKFFGKLYLTNDTSQNLSFIEDFNNHFHVSDYIEPPDNQKSFMLAVKVLKLLAEKFKSKGLTKVRFWLSFQTPELGKQFAEDNRLNEDNDEHFISDRLSFYKKREGENVFEIEDGNKKYSALMMIDI